MNKLIITGGIPLKGTVYASGSKNAALPIIAASLLCKEEITLKNIPDIEDVHIMLKILKSLNVKTKFKKGILKINAEKLKSKTIKKNLVCKLRASILMLSPLLVRTGKAFMAFPGGCLIGKRSIFTHLYVLEKLGAKILKHEKTIKIRLKRLKGTTLVLPEISVTATENAIIAAVFAKGETSIRLAACEPHVQDLCCFLNQMGAKISGIGTHTLKIKGILSLNKTSYTITSDYLETATLAIAAAATNGKIEIKNIIKEHLDSFWQKLESIGVKISFKKNNVIIKGTKKLKPVVKLQTSVFPSFPTDLQAPFAVLLTQANGVSKIFETLFEERLSYLFELEKMGAKIEILNSHQALIIGPRKLKGIPVSSCDLRAGAAMVIAALTAEGQTEINNVYYIDRGYEKLDEKLKKLGAKIKRV